MSSIAYKTVLKLAPKAKDNYLKAIQQSGPLFEQHGITTPLRLSHFLAQALHETGGFTVLRESMKYRAPRILEIFGVGKHSAAVTPAEAEQLAGNEQALAERVYGLGNPKKALELGNTQPGDGFLFRGNGVLQMTGRGHHRRMSQLCGVDFEGTPALATEPEYALLPALFTWTSGNLNAYADKNDIRTITRRINGGYTGVADREDWFEKLWKELKPKGTPEAAWETSDADADVVLLQNELNTLGANPRVVVDGRYGPATKRAVIQFQKIAGLKADGIAGPVTRAAMQLRLASLR